MCLFCRIQNPNLNFASVQEGAPWANRGDIAWGGNPGHLEAPPLWILPIWKLSLGVLELLLLSPGNTPGCEVSSLESLIQLAWRPCPQQSGGSPCRLASLEEDLVLGNARSGV